MKYSIFLFILIFPVLLMGQTGGNIDSLEQQLPIHKKAKDYPAYAEVILLLTHFTEAARNFDQAISYIEEGQQVVPKDLRTIHQKFSYKWYLLHFEKGPINAQNAYLLDSAYQNMRRFADQLTLLRFMKFYAWRMQNCTLSEKANQTLKEAERMCTQQDSLRSHLLEIYSELYKSERDLGNREASIDYLRKAIDASKESKDYTTMVSLYIDNAGLLSEYRMDGVMESYQKALEIATAYGNERDLAAANLGISYYYNSIGEPQKVLEALQIAQPIFERLNEADALIAVQKSMANAYNALGQIEQLSKLYKKNFALCEATHQTACRSIYYDYVYELDTILPVDTAIFYLRKQEILSRSLKDKIMIASTAEYLSLLYREKGDFEAALLYFEEAKLIQDTIAAQDFEAKVAEEGTRQQVERFEEAKDAAELRTQVLSYRNQLFIAISLGLLIILGVTSYLIWQLRKARRTLAEQNLRLSQLNDTKDRFFSIIAHDIRSPITALSGIGEQMDFYIQKKDEKKLNRLASRIENTAQKLSNLLDNLLNWALLQKGMIPYHPKIVNLHEVVEENLQLYAEVAAMKGIQLVNQVESNESVYADLSAVSTIIRNLINNAVKFTDKNGQVSISTETVKDKLFININDTGTGISADRLSTLFSLNTNSRKGTANEKGSGLGLMLCKDLVELNKGTIKAISELGKGSSFIFSLPVRQMG